tara:strand:+ start:6940 stop:8448 length:1509 start_codon:yes stop_codon:yes gene_type:complete
VKKKNPRVSFSEYYGVNKTALKKAGFFNISLISDLPLFIDPFHLFHSDKPEYKQLHDEIIKYLVFLRKHSIAKKGQPLTSGEMLAYYKFPEVKQNWFGYAVIGNAGRGLGKKFATELNDNFYNLFKTSPPEHLEKLTLVASGVGKDNISDFTTNLIHVYLAGLTQEFAKKHIDKSKLGKFTIKKAEFDYKTKTWKPKTFTLPKLDGDYVLLTPKDLLTKEDTWINRTDLIEDFEEIPYAATNAELRTQLISYFNEKLKEYREEKVSKKTGKKRQVVTKKTRRLAAQATIQRYPAAIDVYIKIKEQSGDQAMKISDEYILETETFKENQYSTFVNSIDAGLQKPTTLDEARSRANYFKECIELKDLYKNLYDANGKPASEDWIQRLFWFVWYGTPSDVNREPKNGLGEPDYTVSIGAKDKSLVEFKLASSTSLEKNVKNQLETYKKTNKTRQGIWVIVVFTDKEYQKVQGLMETYELDPKDHIIVDARKNNKKTASKADNATN